MPKSMPQVVSAEGLTFTKLYIAYIEMEMQFIKQTPVFPAITPFLSDQVTYHDACIYRNQSIIQLLWPPLLILTSGNKKAAIDTNDQKLYYHIASFVFLNLAQEGVLLKILISICIP